MPKKKTSAKTLIIEDDEVQEEGDELNPFSFKEFIRSKNKGPDTHTDQDEKFYPTRTTRRKTYGSSPPSDRDLQTPQKHPDPAPDPEEDWSGSYEPAALEESQELCLSLSPDGPGSPWQAPLEYDEQDEASMVELAYGGPKTRLQKLLEENSQLKRNAKDMAKKAADDNRRLQELTDELHKRKLQEESEAQALETMVHSVEQNLHLMTRTNTPKKRMRPTAAELSMISEDEAHEGMTTLEEDQLDEWLLENDQEETEEDMEHDLQSTPSAGRSRSGPKSARKDLPDKEVLQDVHKKRKNEMEPHTKPSPSADRSRSTPKSARKDLPDKELLQDVQGHKKKDEMEPHTKPSPSADHSRSTPKSAIKRKLFPDSVSDFSYSDTDSQAEKPLPFRPSRPVGIDLSSVRRDSRSLTNKMMREIDFFMLFFAPAIVAEICSFTNRRGWELVVNRPSYSSYEGTWIEVTTDEFYKFLGLLIYMGFSVLPDVHRYWGTKSLQGSWARGFMSRNRFKSLLAALHVVDPAIEDNQDRLTKLRYLMDHLKQKCQQLFQPNQNISIDERMVKSKGRSGFKQYMKAKPTRWGFKLWVIATSDSGYTLDFDVYTGSRDGPVNDLGARVVESLMQPFKDQGHNIWFDNFYTSPALMVKLLEMGTNACGTCRVTRKLIPEEFKDIKRWERKAARGDMRWCRIDGNILVIQWKDIRAVTCLSNFHNANDTNEVTRLVRDDGSWTKEAVRQPAVISDYNKNMGGVDKSDQMIKYYEVLQKTQKWWKTLFFHFVDIAVVNSFILFKEWQNSHPAPKGGRSLGNYTQIDFRENLARQLGGIGVNAGFPSDSRKGPVGPPSSSLHTVHVPKFEESSKRCWLCYRNSKTENRTKVACSAPDCNGKRLCLIRDRNCFQSWHSAECDWIRQEA